FLFLSPPLPPPSSPLLPYTTLFRSLAPTTPPDAAGSAWRRWSRSRTLRGCRYCAEEPVAADRHPVPPTMSCTGRRARKPHGPHHRRRPSRSDPRLARRRQPPGTAARERAGGPPRPSRRPPPALVPAPSPQHAPCPPSPSPAIPIRSPPRPSPPASWNSGSRACGRPAAPQPPTTSSSWSVPGSVRSCRRACPASIWRPCARSSTSSRLRPRTRTSPAWAVSSRASVTRPPSAASRSWAEGRGPARPQRGTSLYEPMVPLMGFISYGSRMILTGLVLGAALGYVLQ